MVASIAAGTSAQYYVHATDYYLGGIEPSGIWLSDGGLGVVVGSKVEAELLERLHAACGPDGKSLLANDGNRRDQVDGYDITFSAPKSVSLAWALSDERRKRQIEAALLRAVKEAVNGLDRYAAFCRRGKGGQILEKIALTVAGFQHGEARPAPHTDGSVFADPALHMHALILNLGQRDDGSFGRLDGRALFAAKMLAGALFHRKLAQELRDLGFGIEIAGKNGIFEIAGIDPELISFFSARRSEITTELGAMGITTAEAPALAAAKALTTRSAKVEVSDGDRHALWRKKVTELGFEPDHVVATALERGKQLAHDGTVVRFATLEDGLRAVLEDLTERASVFEFRSLVAGVAAHLTAYPHDISVDGAIALIFENQLAVSLATDRWGHAICSTPEIIALEQGLSDRARRLADCVVDAPDAALVAAHIDQSNLNPEQMSAARVACQSNAISLTQGGPGVGKTTLLNCVAAVWKEEGWRVIGAASAWKIANQLRDELSIEARALASWLARYELGQEFLTDKTLLVIDEAGLLTSGQMDTLLRAVEDANASGKQVALRMVGDGRQLQPIGGPGLRIVTDAIGTQRVDTIVRQHQPWARGMVTEFGKGNANAGLKYLTDRQHLHLCAGPRDTINKLVHAWDGHRTEHPHQTRLLIARSNRQVQEINEAARQRLRARGELGQADLTQLSAATPSGQSYTLPLAAGEAIRFLTRNDDIGVINGTTGRLLDASYDARGELVLRAEIEGRSVTVRPSDLADEQGRVQLSHAYATTCYGAQGLTTDQAFVLVDATMDRHAIFVAASRHRDVLEAFVDTKDLDTRAKAARLLTDRARSVGEGERLSVLADALSRSGTRVSTLDFLPAHDANHTLNIEPATKPDDDRKRQRTRGISHEL